MMADALDTALAYAAVYDWPLFPCQWAGPGRKRPLVKYWRALATADAGQLTRWFHQWPQALIALATGAVSGRDVLDIDVKDPRRNGLDTLDGLGFAVLPDTPIAHTASGGLHIHFAHVDGLRNTAGSRGRGIGDGLDWRGDGGFVILPSEGSGYRWDDHCGPALPLAAIPAALLPRNPPPARATRPVEPFDGLSPYARAALNRACRAIIDARAGEQEQTLHRECFAIGTLAGAGGIPEGFARRALTWAARQLHSYRSREPWHASELDRKVSVSFTRGRARPRGRCV
jgi:hypothetical protein